jgi:hypothetical protein
MFSVKPRNFALYSPPTNSSLQQTLSPMARKSQHFPEKQVTFSFVAADKENNSVQRFLSCRGLLKSKLHWLRNPHPTSLE